MVQFARRNAESQANLFVVNATTPAQLFHALRRQMNRPYQKPLVLLTPKFLLHHRPATSALADFATGTYFNRVIDDCKVCLAASLRLLVCRAAPSHLLLPNPAEVSLRESPQNAHSQQSAGLDQTVHDCGAVTATSSNRLPPFIIQDHTSIEKCDPAWCEMVCTAHAGFGQHTAPIAAPEDRGALPGAPPPDEEGGALQWCAVLPPEQCQAAAQDQGHCACPPRAASPLPP